MGHGICWIVGDPWLRRGDGVSWRYTTKLNIAINDQDDWPRKCSFHPNHTSKCKTTELKGSPHGARRKLRWYLKVIMRRVINHCCGLNSKEPKRGMIRKSILWTWRVLFLNKTFIAHFYDNSIAVGWPPSVDIISMVENRCRCSR